MAVLNWFLPPTHRVAQDQIFEASVTTVVPLVAKGVSGQSANVFEVRNSADSVLFSVDNSGNITAAGNVTVTVNEAVTGNETITGSLTVNGNTTIGNAASDTLTVNATSTFAAPVTFSGGITGGFSIDDDEIFALGSDADQVFINRSAALAANTGIVNVLVGSVTAAAIPGNSLIISNTTADGDIIFAAQTGGNSSEMLRIDGSAPGVVFGSDTNAAKIMVETPTSNNPVYSFQGDEGTGMSRAAAGQLSLTTNGTEMIRILGGSAIRINEGGGDVDTRISGNNQTNLFYTDAGNDRIGIGTATPEYDFELRGANPNLVTSGFDSGTGQLGIGGIIRLNRSKSASVNIHTIVTDNDGLGTIYWGGSDGTNFDNAAAIWAEVDGTPGAGSDMPGALVFATSADGSATPTEALRIDSSQSLSVATEILFTERADHNFTPAAGRGILWVRNDSPNVLVFTDDAGSDTVLGAGGGGGLAFLAMEATEQTTTSISAVDLVTISSLSIAAGTRVRVVGKVRKSSGAAAAAGIGLKINSTDVVAATTSANAIVNFSSTDRAENATFELEFEVGESNYQSAILGSSSVRVSSDGTSVAHAFEPSMATLTAIIPSATVTDIIITGISGSASVTLAAVDVRVYTYANS